MVSYEIPFPVSRGVKGAREMDDSWETKKENTQNMCVLFGTSVEVSGGTTIPLVLRIHLSPRIT